MIQKIARAAVKTNNINSFHYLGRGEAYRTGSDQNTPLEDLPKASRIYLLGTEIHEENAMEAFLFYTTSLLNDIPVSLISHNKSSKLEKKADQIIKTESYYAFLKATIFHLLSENKENALFIKDHCIDFEKYKEKILAEDYSKLIEDSGLDKNTIEKFADKYNKEQNAILLFSETNISGNEASEIRNLALLCGKLGKTASGLICLKEKNNSQGLWDMGINPQTTCGSRNVMDPDVKSSLSKTWKVEDLAANVNKDTLSMLQKGEIKNMFVFGEDPVGCAVSPEEIEAWFNNCDFTLVQDYFMTETAKMADLILPASLPMEMSGTFTNTQRIVQEFNQTRASSLQLDAPEQLIKLAETFGLNGVEDSADARSEAFSIIANRKDEATHRFVHTINDGSNSLFEHGCDILVKRFDEEFDNSFDK